ncbi:MAG: RNA polymerase sigma factor WhiG [Actinomycetota bacterium]
MASTAKKTAKRGDKKSKQPKKTATKSKTAPEAPDPATLELDALWREFKDRGEASSRERLILHYAPLVKFVASRVATGLPSSIEQADLASYGMFGLIDALDKFDAERGFKFETYAIPRIKGAIIDELRAMDWVPRSVRFKAREIEKAYAEIETREKRQPTEGEVAQRLGVSVTELHDTISQVSFVSVLALDEALAGGGDRDERLSLLDTLADAHVADPATGVEDQETRVALAGAINSLSEREKIVLTLYYFEGLTLAEIGETLGVTESRICQIHTKAVGELRTNLVGLVE